MDNAQLFSEQKVLKARNGLPVLALNTAAILVFIALFILGIVMAAQAESAGTGAAPAVLLIIASVLMGFMVCPFLFAGLKILKPNEALVLTLFGRYYGTLYGPGFYFVNPFVSAVNPTKPSLAAATAAARVEQQKKPTGRTDSSDPTDTATGRAVSLKVMTLDNNKQKINDKLGNPIEIGVVVIWRVVNPAKAVFNVDNYLSFLSIQADSSLRNIVRLYPYDIWSDDEDADELSLRGSSQAVALKLKDELQSKVMDAGLEIMETRITHLAYAPEIAAAMLQRQQASAIIDARKLIVEGAVGMVDMALQKLCENEIVTLDDERKAAMVSNLLVVLCGSKEAQPVVNSGSLY
ncbi:SPFH domain-containing protein [Bacillota bacterium Meth-B3]|nr:SPFH domain-containing protein [Christensenellaceae bacterium]MEA5064451.1 SPFH domain-containing protein [Eubacteriales bacterium]MEA5068570.1 SPFH domain-containing protein [Christensenellaceae bacterium]